MEIKYEVTEEDYIRFNIYHAENSKAHKKNYNMLKYWIPLFGGAIIFITGSFLLKQSMIYWTLISLGFLGIWIWRFPKTYERLIRKSSRAMLEEGDNSAMISKTTMIVREDELEVISDHTVEKTYKAGVKDIKVYDDMILIYLSGFSAHIVPTRYLNEGEKEELLERLGTWIG